MLERDGELLSFVAEVREATDKAGAAHLMVDWLGERRPETTTADVLEIFALPTPLKKVRCIKCSGYGELPVFEPAEKPKAEWVPCKDCRGSGLAKSSFAMPPERDTSLWPLIEAWVLYAMGNRELHNKIKAYPCNPYHNPIDQKVHILRLFGDMRIRREIRSTTLDRRARTQPIENNHGLIIDEVVIEEWLELREAQSGRPMRLNQYNAQSVTVSEDKQANEFVITYHIRPEELLSPAPPQAHGEIGSMGLLGVVRSLEEVDPDWSNRDIRQDRWLRSIASATVAAPGRSPRPATRT